MLTESFILGFFIAVLWLIIAVVLSINADTIRKEEGITSNIFNMTLVLVIFAYLIFIYYVLESVKAINNIGDAFYIPIPIDMNNSFSHLGIMIVAIYIITVNIYTLVKYESKYKNSDTIPDWKKSLLFISNIISMILSTFELRRGRHIYTHFKNRNRERISDSEENK